MRIIKSIGLALAALLLVSASVAASTPKEIMANVQTEFDAIGAAGGVLSRNPTMENVQVVVDTSMDLLIVLSQEDPDVCAIDFYILFFDFSLNNISVGTAIINGADQTVVDFLIGRVTTITQQLQETLDDCDGPGNSFAV